MTQQDIYTRFYEIIRCIPDGRVSTYGQVAALAGLPGRARQVGYALNALPPGSDIPWQRVINAKGQVSKRADPVFEEIQRRLLEEEGLRFDDGDRISLAEYQWIEK
ncbi:MAG: MGMT family protein [Chloroflexota bacterium]